MQFINGTKLESVAEKKIKETVNGARRVKI